MYLIPTNVPANIIAPAQVIAAPAQVIGAPAQPTYDKQTHCAVCRFYLR